MDVIKVESRAESECHVVMPVGEDTKQVVEPVAVSCPSVNAGAKVSSCRSAFS
jgi:hypothetical protein